MRLCVFGAGAVGGYLAARLLQAGHHDVAVVARGEHLRAIAAHGLTLRTADEDIVVRPHALAEDPGELPAQDVVFVTVKAHAQPAAAHGIAALLGSQGTAVFVNNGIPWWWPYRGPAHPGEPLPLLDPGGALWSGVRPARALGCVVYSANEVLRPGVVRHTANNRWLLGEPDGSRTPRLLSVVRVLREAGLNAEDVPDLRAAIWHKLLRNAALNSVCALTRLPVDALGRDPGLVLLCERVIDEIVATAAADGCDLSAHVETAKAAPRQGAAIDGRPAAGIRPSMLQDVLAGRRLEVEPILGQVQAFAREGGVATPVLDVLLALVRGLDRAGSQIFNS